MSNCLGDVASSAGAPRPSIKEEVARAVARASRDPIARRRRELLEHNEHLIIPEKPRRFSPATVSRLLWCAFKRTEEGA